MAQADDALLELKRQLRISATIRDFKIAQVGGTSQKMGTRTRSLLDRFYQKTLRCGRRYSAAFAALSKLDPGGEWADRLRYLNHATDIRGPHREDDDPSEGKREMSWIWLAPRPNGCPTDADSPNEMSDSKLFIYHGIIPF